MTAGSSRRRRPDPAQGRLGSEGGSSRGGRSSAGRCWRRLANRLCDITNIGRYSASTSAKYTVRTIYRKTSDAFSGECPIHVAFLASTTLLLAVRKRASNPTSVG